MNITLYPPLSFSQQGRRARQEDARYPDNDRPEPLRRCFVVADGVGGEVGGERASHLVADTLGQTIDNALANGGELAAEVLADALHRAYVALDREATGDYRGMSTTVAVAVVHDGGLTLAHVGDSRIYLVRPEMGIVYRSDDHSLVNQMIHSGLITPEQGIDHPQSNVITRCIERVERDQRRAAATVFCTVDVRPGDYVLLCTDGVVHCIDDEMLAHLLGGDAPDGDKMAALADACRQSADNNTAILLHLAAVDGNPLQPDETPPVPGADTASHGRKDHILFELEAAPLPTSRAGDNVSFWRKIFS